MEREEKDIDGANVIGVVFFMVIVIWMTWMFTSTHYEREALHYGCMEQADNGGFHWLNPNPQEELGDEGE